MGAVGVGISPVFFRKGAAGSSPLLDGLFAYWKLDEVSDGTGPVTRSDSHTGGYHLTDLANARSAAGKVGNGVDFEADSSQSLSNAVVIDWSESWTVAFWCKPEALLGSGNYLCVLSQGGSWGTGCGPQIKLAFNSAMACLFYKGDNNDNVTVHGNVKAVGSWTFLAFVHDSMAKEVRAYTSFSGSFVLEESLGYVWVPAVSALPLVISPAGNYHFDGVMDEFGIWSRALSLEELGELWNGDVGVTYPFV